MSDSTRHTLPRPRSWGFVGLQGFSALFVMAAGSCCFLAIGAQPGTIGVLAMFAICGWLGWRLPVWLRAPRLGDVVVEVDDGRVQIDGESFQRTDDSAVLVESHQLAGSQSWVAKFNTRHNVKWLPRADDAEEHPTATTAGSFGRHRGNSKARRGLILEGFRDRHEVRQFAETVAARTGADLVWKEIDGDLRRRSHTMLDASVVAHLDDQQLPEWPERAWSDLDHCTVRADNDGGVRVTWQPEQWPLVITVPGGILLGASVGALGATPEIGVLASSTFGAAAGGIWPVARRMLQRHRGSEVRFTPDSIALARKKWGLRETVDRFDPDRIKTLRVDNHARPSSRRLVAIDDEGDIPLGPPYRYWGDQEDPVRRAALIGLAGTAPEERTSSEETNSST